MKKPLQDLNLTDDIFFTLLMQQEAFCRQVLNIILNKEFTKITYQQVQKAYQNLPGYKSIRLDVYAEDSDGNIYNVEMQKQEQNDLPKYNVPYKVDRTRRRDCMILDTAGGNDRNLPGLHNL